MLTAAETNGEVRVRSGLLVYKQSNKWIYVQESEIVEIKMQRNKLSKERRKSGVKH